MASGEHVIIWAGRFILWCSRVRIRAGRFVCSMLTLEGYASGEVRSCWITCVGLQAGKSVELDYERGGS